LSLLVANQLNEQLAPLAQLLFCFSCWQPIEQMIGTSGIASFCLFWLATDQTSSSPLMLLLFGFLLPIGHWTNWHFLHIFWGIDGMTKLLFAAN